MNETIKEVKKELREKYGNINRIDKCIDKTASMWTESDGSKEDFKNFCLRHFIADGTMISKPLEDMYPFLDRDEFYSNMITNNFKEQI